MARAALVAIAAAARPAAAVNQNLPATGGSRENAIDTLARTLWGEARLEPVRTIEAVAAVVLNRLSRAADGDESIVSVCRRPGAFACWDETRPDYPHLLAVTAGEPVFDTCLRVARRAVAGVLPDATKGATRYHPLSAHPAWTTGALPTAEIGGLLFYEMESYREEV